MKSLRAAIFLAFGVLALGVYGLAEARGWAGDGKRVPERIEPSQLRRASPGSWTYVYWYHGVRGK
ncbi:MAG: hypothetical protein AAF682_30640 [Planctomycetota bacterium]